MLYYLDLFGTAVFAITGALAARRKQLDLLGVVVLALVTALGGGTVRDLLLGASPVFWIRDNTYIAVPAITAILMFATDRLRSLEDTSIRIPDAVGLAAFTVIGANVALSHHTTWVVVVIMGMMTGVAGGMIRDVLAGEIPMILRSEIYATASMCGALVYYGLSVNYTTDAYGHLPIEEINMTAAMLVTLCMRLVSIKFNLSLPGFGRA